MYEVGYAGWDNPRLETGDTGGGSGWHKSGSTHYSVFYVQVSFPVTMYVTEVLLQKELREHFKSIRW